MAILTTKKRKSLKSSTFGLPKERKYPMPDKSHAVNAKARATQMVKKGKLSKASEEKIDAKANKIIKRGRPSMGKTLEKAHEKLKEKHEKLKEKHANLKDKHKEDVMMLKQKYKAKLMG